MRQIQLNPPAPALILADTTNVVDDCEIVALVPPGTWAIRLREGAESLCSVLREKITLSGLTKVMQRFTIPTLLRRPAAIKALEPRVTAGVNHA